MGRGNQWLTAICLLGATVDSADTVIGHALRKQNRLVEINNLLEPLDTVG